MNNTKDILKGLQCCSFDKDVIPLCEHCPYSFNGEKCEDNETSIRCCDELKNDLLKYFTLNQESADKEK